VPAPDRLVALGADLLEQSLADQAGEHLGHGAALQLSGELIDGAVGPLAGLAEDDELGVGELSHRRLLQGFERARDHREPSTTPSPACRRGETPDLALAAVWIAYRRDPSRKPSR